MYYTGLHPITMEPVYVPKNPHEKAIQRALLQYRNPENYSLVEEGLRLAGREDLIGWDRKCLLRPRNGKEGRRESCPEKKDGFRKTGGNTKKTKKKTIRNVHQKKRMKNESKKR